MERIKIYFPKQKYPTIASLSILSFNEIMSLLKNIDKYYKNGTLEYHYGLRNIYKYIIREHLDKLSIDQIKEFRVQETTHKRTTNLIKEGIKVIQKKITKEMIEENKRLIKEAREIKKNKDKIILEKEKNTIYINFNDRKYYKMKLKIQNILKLYHYLKNIDLLSGKIQIKEIELEKERRELKNIGYLDNFFKSLKEKKQTYYEFIDYLSIYIYVITRSFKLKTSSIKWIFSKKNIRTNVIEAIVLIFNNNEKIIIAPKFHDQKFVLKFGVVYNNSKNYIALTDSVKIDIIN